MKQYKYITLTIALLSSSVLIAQDDNPQAYEYQLIRNDPEFARNILVGIDPVIVDLNDYNPTMGAGVSATVRFMNRVQLDLSYQHAYLHIMEDDMYSNTGHAFSIYETSPANSFDATLKVFWESELEESKESVYLKSSGRVEYHARIPCERLRQVGARIGYTRGIAFLSNDHAVYKGYSINDPSKAVRELSGVGFSNMMEYSFLNLGVTYTRLSDLEVRFKDLPGNRGAESMNEIYGDIMFATKMKLDDMWIPEDYSIFYSNYQQYHVDEHTPKIRYGIKAGYKYQSLSGFGLQVAVEGGITPGLKQDGPNAFFLAKVGMVISARVK
jgi:hypothetical protein